MSSFTTEINIDAAADVDRAFARWWSDINEMRTAVEVGVQYDM